MTNHLTFTVIHAYTDLLLSYLPCGCLSQHADTWHKTQCNDYLLTAYIISGGRTGYMINKFYLITKCVVVRYSPPVYTGVTSTLVLIYWLYL